LLERRGRAHFRGPHDGGAYNRGDERGPGLLGQHAAGVREGHGDGFDGFNAAMGKMIANKEAKQAAEAEKAEKAAAVELKKVGAALKKEISAAEDPELKQAGETSAAKLTKSAADTKFFDSIKSPTDLNKHIEAKMLDWMTPVRGYCA
jgi:hypothetical protein